MLYVFKSPMMNLITSKTQGKTHTHTHLKDRSLDIVHRLPFSNPDLNNLAAIV